ARIVARRRRVACGAAAQVCHIVERGAAVELPMLDAVIAFGMNGQNGGRLAAARDDVAARRYRELRLLHDQAMLLQPPVRTVEFPQCRRDAALQGLVAAEPYAP